MRRIEPQVGVPDAECGTKPALQKMHRLRQILRGIDGVDGCRQDIDSRLAIALQEAGLQIIDGGIPAAGHGQHVSHPTGGEMLRQELAVDHVLQAVMIAIDLFYDAGQVKGIEVRGEGQRQRGA